MIYIRIDEDTKLPLEVLDYKSQFFESGAAIGKSRWDTKTWQSRWDWKTFEEVGRLALYITAMTGKSYVSVDDGTGVSPRFDIAVVPQVGDPVSYGFNGDYYPDGEIVKISKKLQITTSTGNRYRRKHLTGGWMKTGGTWSLVKGHISEQNPHF